jgi:hypothetical protein
VLVAVVLSLALPGAAAAQSFSVAAHLPTPRDPKSLDALGGGPALAGDRVLWWESRAGTAVLVSARAGEAPHDLLALPPRPARGIRGTFSRVAASDGIAIAERLTVSCPPSAGDCKVVAAERFRLDPATGASTPFDTCLGAPGCARCLARDGLVFFDLVGGVFSEGDGCLTGGGVLDFADGATRRLAGPVVAAAGRYAIVDTGGPHDEQLELVDWRSGAPLRRLADLAGIERDRQVSVAGDGTVAWASRDAEVLPLGAKDPVAVPFPPVPGGSIADQLRLGGGLLAVRRVTRRSLEDVHTFQLTGLDGSDRREVDGQRVGGGWAFDGRRLAWATQPCAQFVIEVWDVAGAPPPDAPDRCAAPAIGSEPIRMRDRRLLPVTLTCPASPAQGCAGILGADLQRPGSHRRVASTFLQITRLPAGATRTVRLAVTTPRRLRGLHRLRASIGFEAFRGGATVAHANVTRR